MQFSAKRFLCTVSTIFLLFGQNLTSNGQELTESTLQKYPKSAQDSIYYELFRAKRTSDLDKAKEYCVLGLKLSQDFDHPKLEVKFYNALGWANQQSGHYELSEQNYRKGIALAEKYEMNERLMFFYNNLGVLFEAQSRFDEALSSYFKSMNYARELKSLRDQIITLNNVGLIYYRISEYQHAIDYFTQGIALAEKNGIETELAFSLTNRGLCLNELKQFEEAKDNFLEAEKQCNKQQDCDNQTHTDLYYGLLFSEYAMGHYPEAKNYFNIGFKFAKLTKNKVSLSLYYHFKAKLLMLDKRYANAIVALDTSDLYARQLQSKLRILNNLELYSEIHEKIGDVNNALRYKNLYIATKDSIFSSSLKDNLNKIQMQEAQKEQQAIIDQ